MFLAAAAVRVRSTTSLTIRSTATGTWRRQRVGALQPGQLEQLLDQSGQPLRLVVDALGEAAGRLRVVGRLEQRLGQQRQRADRGLELVADVGHEVAAHPGHPVRLGDVGRLDRHVPGRVVRTGQRDHPYPHAQRLPASGRPPPPRGRSSSTSRRTPLRRTWPARVRITACTWLGRDWPASPARTRPRANAAGLASTGDVVGVEHQHADPQRAQGVGGDPLGGMRREPLRPAVPADGANPLHAADGRRQVNQSTPARWPNRVLVA